jgi:hypothetical protein
VLIVNAGSRKLAGAGWELTLDRPACSERKSSQPVSTATAANRPSDVGTSAVERVTRIELALSAWEVSATGRWSTGRTLACGASDCLTARNREVPC